MLSNEMLEDLEYTLNEYFEKGLTKEQIINIYNKLNLYPLDEEVMDKFSILKYACLIRNEISEYFNHNVHSKDKNKYYRYNTINYSIIRTLSNIDETFKVELIEDSILENQVNSIESDIKLEILNKKINTLVLI